MFIKYKKLSTKENIDTGMALTLICLLFGNIFIKINILNIIAIIVLILNMSFPIVFKPAAYIWLNVSHLLGNIVSKILLSIIFFSIVTPIGILVRSIKNDPLKLKYFNKSSGSVFNKRNHTFSENDLKYPY